MAGVKPSALAATSPSTESAPEKTIRLQEKKEKRSADGRYIDNGDGTITDTRTDLMWTKKDSWADTGKCLNWNDANGYVSRLNTGGYSDWRLPTVKELKSIYEESISNNNAINFGRLIILDSVFVHGNTFGFWTSEEAASCCAKYVYSESGFLFTHEGNRDFCGFQGVRAVRR